MQRDEPSAPPEQGPDGTSGPDEHGAKKHHLRLPHPHLPHLRPLPLWLRIALLFIGWLVVLVGIAAWFFPASRESSLSSSVPPSSPSPANASTGRSEPSSNAGPRYTNAWTDSARKSTGSYRGRAEDCGGVVPAGGRGEGGSDRRARGVHCRGLARASVPRSRDRRRAPWDLLMLPRQGRDHPPLVHPCSPPLDRKPASAR